MKELMTEMQAQMDVLATPVQHWLNWMLGVFVASILFVWQHKTARIVLAAFLLTMPVGMGIFYFWPNVHLLGIAHLIVWVPLLFYIKRTDYEDGIDVASLYKVWLFLLCGTIMVSLVFDVRDIALVILGHK